KAPNPRGKWHLPLNASDPRGSGVELELVAVGEGVSELLLVRDQQDAMQVPTEVLQLLDHHLPALAVQAAEALVDDHRLDRPVLPAGVLADAQRQADRDAEALAAAEERDVDRAAA